MHGGLTITDEWAPAHSITRLWAEYEVIARQANEERYAASDSSRRPLASLTRMSFKGSRSAANSSSSVRDR